MSRERLKGIQQALFPHLHPLRVPIFSFLNLGENVMPFFLPTCLRTYLFDFLQP